MGLSQKYGEQSNIYPFPSRICLKVFSKLVLILILCLILSPSVNGQDIGPIVSPAKVGDLVNSIDISSDGQFLAAASGNIIYLFAKNGSLLWSYTKKEYPDPLIIGAGSVVITPDGQYIAAGSTNGKVILFSKDGTILWTNNIEKEVKIVAISDDAQYIVTGSPRPWPDNNTLYMFSRNGGVLWINSTISTLSSIAITPDAQYIVVGSVSGPPNNQDKLYLFSKQGFPLWSTAIGNIYSVAISSDGQYIAAGSGGQGDLGNKIYLFSRNGTPLWSSTVKENIMQVALSKDGQYVGAMTDSKVYLFSHDGKMLWSFYPEITLDSFSIAPDGQYIAVTDGFTRLYVMSQNGTLLWSYPIISSRCLSISPDGLYIAVGGGRGNIYLFSRDGIIPPQPSQNKIDYKIDYTIPALIGLLIFGCCIIILLRKRFQKITRQSPVLPNPVSKKDIPIKLKSRTPTQFPEELSPFYSEIHLLGSGGFAQVFKAKKKNGITVAVKVPLFLDPKTGKSFIAEMQNWTKLTHKNIVRVFDFNIMPIPYFEMELCDGSLADIKKPMECEEAAWIIFNVCEGLKFAHAQSIIHRDLKPQNILLKDVVPKIADWGLSRDVLESKSTTTISYTPYYAAPEQIGNKPKDARTDIWQLGVILYELITGILPFTGGSMIEIGMGIATKDPQPPGKIIPGAKVLDAVVMKCIKKNPAQRYQSVLELQKDLGGYLRQNYSESLKMSVNAKDNNRSVYYCGDLVMINLLTGDIRTSYKYLLDLVHYAKGDVKVEAQELSEQIKMRIEEGMTELPDELIQKVEIIVHQVRVGFRDS